MNDAEILKKILKKLSLKISKNESISLLYALYTTILLSKELFKFNVDIKNFLVPIFNKLQSQPEFSKQRKPLEFGDYVYKSRSLIIARFIRIIQKSEDKSIDILISAAQELVDSKYNNVSKKTPTTEKKKKSHKNSVDELLKIFGRYQWLI